MPSALDSLVAASKKWGVKKPPPPADPRAGKPSYALPEVFSPQNVNDLSEEALDLDRQAETLQKEFELSKQRTGTTPPAPTDPSVPRIGPRDMGPLDHLKEFATDPYRSVERAAPYVKKVMGAAGAVLGGVTGTINALPAAIGEELASTPYPGHENESTGTWNRALEHLKMVARGEGGGVVSQDPIRASINAPDPMLDPEEVANLENIIGRKATPAEVKRPRSEMFLKEVGRQLAGEAFRMGTDPVMVGAMAPGKVGGLLRTGFEVAAPFFAAEGVDTAARTFSDPKATPEQKTVAAITGGVMALPAVMHTPGKIREVMDRPAVAGRERVLSRIEGEQAQRARTQAEFDKTGPKSWSAPTVKARDLSELGVRTAPQTKQFDDLAALLSEAAPNVSNLDLGGSQVPPVSKAMMAARDVGIDAGKAKGALDTAKAEPALRPETRPNQPTLKNDFTKLERQALDLHDAGVEIDRLLKLDPPDYAAVDAVSQRVKDYSAYPESQRDPETGATVPPVSELLRRREGSQAEEVANAARQADPFTKVVPKTVAPGVSQPPLENVLKPGEPPPVDLTSPQEQAGFNRALADKTELEQFLYQNDPEFARYLEENDPKYQKAPPPAPPPLAAEAAPVAPRAPQPEPPIRGGQMGTPVARGIVQPGLPIAEEPTPARRRYSADEPPPPVAPAEPVAAGPAVPPASPPAPAAAAASRTAPINVDDVLSGKIPDPGVTLVDKPTGTTLNASGVNQGGGTSAESEARFKVQKFGLIDRGGNLRPLIDGTGVDVRPGVNEAKAIVNDDGTATYVEGDQRAFANFKPPAPVAAPPLPAPPAPTPPPVEAPASVLTSPAPRSENRPGLVPDRKAPPVKDASGNLVPDPNAFLLTDTSIVGLDPIAYQHKASAPGTGVTGALAGVTEWEPASPPILLHERGDGSLFVANGHQRLAKYRELQAQGKELPPLRARIMREADGVDVPTIRRMAAMQNVTEGTATPMDVAKLIREAPLTDTDRGRIAKGERSGAILRSAEGLAPLSDQGFQAVYDSGVNPDAVASVAKYFPDPAKQVAAIQAISKRGIDTYLDGEAYARVLSNRMLVKAEGKAQGNFFGDPEFEDISYVQSQLDRSFEKTLKTRYSAVKNALTNKDYLEKAGVATVDASGKTVRDDVAGLRAFYVKYRDLSGTATNNALQKLAGDLYGKRISPDAATDYLTDALRRDIDTFGAGDGPGAAGAGVQPGAGGGGDAESRTAPGLLEPAAPEPPPAVEPPAPSMFEEPAAPPPPPKKPVTLEDMLARGSQEEPAGGAGPENVFAGVKQAPKPVTLDRFMGGEEPPPGEAPGDVFAETKARSPESIANKAEPALFPEVTRGKDAEMPPAFDLKELRASTQRQIDTLRDELMTRGGFYGERGAVIRQQMEANVAALKELDARIAGTFGEKPVVPEKPKQIGDMFAAEPEAPKPAAPDPLTGERVWFPADEFNAQGSDVIVEKRGDRYAIVSKNTGEVWRELSRQELLDRQPELKGAQEGPAAPPAVKRKYRGTTPDEYASMSAARTAAVDAADARGPESGRTMRSSGESEKIFNAAEADTPGSGVAAVEKFWNDARAKVEATPALEGAPQWETRPNGGLSAPEGGGTIKIRFPTKPGSDVTQYLNKNGWTYRPKDREWHAAVEGRTADAGLKRPRPLEDLLADADRFLGSGKAEPAPPVPTIDEVAAKPDVSAEDIPVINKTLQDVVDKAIEATPEPTKPTTIDEVLAPPPAEPEAPPRPAPRVQARTPLADVARPGPIPLKAKQWGKLLDDLFAKVKAGDALVDVTDWPKIMSDWPKQAMAIADKYGAFAADIVTRRVRAGAIMEAYRQRAMDAKKTTAQKIEGNPQSEVVGEVDALDLPADVTPQAIREMTELASRMDDFTRYTRAGEGAALTSSDQSFPGKEAFPKRSEMERQARERAARIENPTPENIDQYMDLHADMQDRDFASTSRNKRSKANDGLPAKSRDPNAGGERVASGFGGLPAAYDLYKKDPAHFIKVMRLLGIPLSTAVGAASEDDPITGALHGFMAGVAMNVMVAAGKAQAAKRLRAMATIRGEKAVGEVPLRQGRDPNRDLDLLQVLMPGSSEHVVPEAYKRMSKIMEDLNYEMAYGPLSKAPGEAQKIQKGRAVQAAVAEGRKIAAELKKQGQIRKSSYVEEMANSLAKKPTNWQMGSKKMADAVGLTEGYKRLTGKNLGNDFIERGLGTNVYRVLTGFAMDTALQNLTQPILALRHVSTGDLAWAYKVAQTPWAISMTKHIEIHRPTDMDVDAAGVATPTYKQEPGVMGWMKDPQRLLAKSDGYNRRIVYLAGLKAAEGRGLFGAYAKEWSRAVTEQTFVGARRFEAADSFAREVMRDTQGDVGPLSFNPHWRGPIGGSARPFTKFPALLIRSLIDTVSQPDTRGRNRFIAAVLATTALGRAAGIDLEDVLLMGGRPFGLDPVSNPKKALSDFLTMKWTPAGRAVSSMQQHAAGTAGHKVAAWPWHIQDFMNSDLATMGLGRFPVKAYNVADQAIRHFPENVTIRTASGAAKDTSQLEQFMSLAGVKSTRATDRADVLGQASREAYDAGGQQKADAGEIKRLMRQAFDNDDPDAVSALAQELAATTHSGGAVVAAMKSLNATQKDRIWKAASPQMRARLTAKYGAEIERTQLSPGR